MKFLWNVAAGQNKFLYGKTISWRDVNYINYIIFVQDQIWLPEIDPSLK